MSNASKLCSFKWQSSKNFIIPIEFPSTIFNDNVLYFDQISNDKEKEREAKEDTQDYGTASKELKKMKEKHAADQIRFHITFLVPAIS